MTKFIDRKRREDCFFGLHFDFHAKPSEDGYIVPIGGKVSKEMIFDIIDTVKPDFIQIDCKGHPGWSSYPTKVGNQYPKIEGDPLKIWRDATTEKGVSLFMHYSGVVDDYQCETHPEWVAKSLDEQRYAKWLPKGITSTFSSYVYKIVIPQLTELAEDYYVDGVWLDGECWGTQVDYSDTAINLFEDQTGIDIRNNLPKGPGDEHWQAYSDFCREQFRKYMQKYVDRIHYSFPDFQIASNWAFSSKMPEAVSVDVDFLSGDYLWADSVNSARYEGRCLASQGKPWDLMAWGFRWRNGDRMERCPKHPEQLKQEAAVVLALGGGFQSYYPQKKDGTVHKWQIDVMKEVSGFCRERESYCHKAQFVPQIAVLNSTYNRYHTSKFLFQCEGEDQALQGTTQLLCETGQSFEILSEHNLTGCMDKYPLIMVPETKIIGDQFKSELLEYAKKGGSLLLIGTDSYNLLRQDLELYGELETGDYMLSDDGSGWAYNHGAFIKNSFAGLSHGFMALQNDIDDGEKYAAAEIVRYGDGLIGFILADIGDTYLKRKSHVHRRFAKSMLGRLYEPKVVMDGPMYVDMTIMEKDGALMINLVNTAGPHANKDVYTIDDIPPVGPVYIKMKRDKEPEVVKLVPSDTLIRTAWDKHKKLLSVKIPQINIYEILVIS